LRRPTLALATAINRAVREADEWFSEPDDVDRVERALASIDDIHEPVAAAGMLAFRVTRAQGFAEGNKRTALLLARWVLDHNGKDGLALLPPDDRDLADLLIKAAAGAEVESQIVELIISRT
jgi:prophage maintenance system killer protein